MSKKDLNRLSATEIMGWEENETGNYYQELEDGIISFSLKIHWTPLTDMNQCMMVVERIRNDGWKINLLDYEKIWQAQCFNRESMWKYLGHDVNPNKAILIAALRAKGVLEVE